MDIYIKKLIAAEKRRQRIWRMSKKMPVKEIAKRLDITPTRVYQILKLKQADS